MMTSDCFQIALQAEATRLHVVASARMVHLHVVASARMVHHAGDAPELSGRRLFVHVRRGGYGLSAAEDRFMTSIELPTGLTRICQRHL